MDITFQREVRGSSSNVLTGIDGELSSDNPADRPAPTNGHRVERGRRDDDGTQSRMRARPGRALGQLRRSRDVTQVELARRLDVSQATVSKFEKSNPAVTTVIRYIEALGGKLELAAVFDDERIVIEY